MNRLSALLLAGGESRRMGQDKATLTYMDRPLWENQLALLRQMEPAELMVSGRSDPAWRPADVIFVADAPPSRGPLSGLAAALGQMSGTHLLVLAVDMPCMNPAFLRSLYVAVTPGCGVVPMMDGRAEPLAAIYPLDAGVTVRLALEGADFSLQRIVSQLVNAGRLRVRSVSHEEVGYFRNLNEPVLLKPQK